MARSRRKKGPSAFEERVALGKPISIKELIDEIIKLRKRIEWLEELSLEMPPDHS